MKTYTLIMSWRSMAGNVLGIADVRELAAQKLIKKQMITNYSNAQQSSSSPYFGNTFVMCRFYSDYE